MHIDWLICFLIAADNLNITEAANRLFISPSTASRQISGLEEEFRIQLFRRRPGVLELTEEGSVFRDYAEKIVHQYEELKTAMHSLHINQGLTFKIAALNMSYYDVILSVFKALKARFPDADMDIQRHYRPVVMDLLTSGELDILLGFVSAFDALPKTIECVPLKKVSFDAVVSASSPLAELSGIHAKDVADQTLYIWERERDPAFFDAIVSACTFETKKPEIVVMPYNREDILWPVISGKGISAFSEGVLRNLPPAVVHRPLLDMPPIDRRFCLFCRKNSQNPLISCARDEFVKAFRQL